MAIIQGSIPEILVLQILRIVGFEKKYIFWIHQIPNSQKFKTHFFFFHPHSNQLNIYGVPWMGLNFYDYPGFQPKIYATQCITHHDIEKISSDRFPGSQCQSRLKRRWHSIFPGNGRGTKNGNLTRGIKRGLRILKIGLAFPYATL